MASQRSTFAKRQREQNRKDKAKAKRDRRAARSAETRVTKGPQIAWDEAVPADSADPTDAAPAAAPPNDTVADAETSPPLPAPRRVPSAGS